MGRTMRESILQTVEMFKAAREAVMRGTGAIGADPEFDNSLDTVRYGNRGEISGSWFLYFQDARHSITARFLWSPERPDYVSVSRLIHVRVPAGGSVELGDTVDFDRTINIPVRSHRSGRYTVPDVETLPFRIWRWGALPHTLTASESYSPLALPLPR